MNHLLEVEINAEGCKLAYLSPIDENDKPKDGFRIAGPKAWGGSRNIARIKLNDADLVRYIRCYAPGVLSELIQGKLK